MSKLFVVPTPIGNLKDITLRALEVLTEVDFVISEETRTTSKLLNHFNIKKQLISYHKYNEHKQLQNIVEKIAHSSNVALVSDAGTPGISDPGFLIIRECIKNNIEVDCLPGATAIIPAIINSGLPNDRFVFEGFLPQKKGRKKRIEFLKDETRTMVFYESPYRLLKTLEDLAEALNYDRNVVVCREISKLYEETVRGSFTYLIDYFSKKTVKGEIVIVVEGNKAI